MRNLYFKMPPKSDCSVIAAVMDKFGYSKPKDEPRTNFRIVLADRVRVGWGRVKNDDIEECHKIAQELGVKCTVTRTRVTFESAPGWVAWIAS